VGRWVIARRRLEVLPAQDAPAPQSEPSRLAAIGRPQP
jgi:hypothetical protein